jgi:hypothetical protein
MNCSRFETLLSDYMEGMLDARVQAAMEQHLQECSQCSALLDEVKALREELRDFPEVSVREELIEQILEHTSGKPVERPLWSGIILPAIRPFLSQRYAFATLLIFAFISFAVNVMGPGFSAASYSRLRPSAIIARADELSSEVYKKWREFNDFKSQVNEELRLFKDDLLGRLDYHLVNILFESYEESLDQEKQEEQDAAKKNEPEQKQEESQHE